MFDQTGGKSLIFAGKKSFELDLSKEARFGDFVGGGPEKLVICNSNLSKI